MVLNWRRGLGGGRGQHGKGGIRTGSTEARSPSSTGRRLPSLSNSPSRNEGDELGQELLGAHGDAAALAKLDSPPAKVPDREPCYGADRTVPGGSAGTAETPEAIDSTARRKGDHTCR